MINATIHKTGTDQCSLLTDITLTIAQLPTGHSLVIFLLAVSLPAISHWPFPYLLSSYWPSPNFLCKCSGNPSHLKLIASSAHIKVQQRLTN